MGSLRRLMVKKIADTEILENLVKKALELDLSVIVCINKCDRPEARPIQVVDEVLELFMDLDANDEQLDCPFVYASAKTGTASTELTVKGRDMTPLFDTILEHIPAPEGDPDAGTQILVSTIDYNEYVGRIGVGKVDNGSVKVNQEVVIVNHHDPDKMKKVKISKLYEYDGLDKVEGERGENRLHRGHLRHCGYPYRRYPLLSR